MNKNYQYKLDTSSKKHICPQCKKKRFVVYVDSKGETLSDSVGRCDREESCGYHYPPKEYFKGNPKPDLSNWKPKIAQVSKAIDFIEDKYLEETLCDYDKNHFVIWLESLFGIEIAAKLVDRFSIGTNSFYHNGVTFWQIDEKGRIRQAKAMPYNPKTGKRLKNATWRNGDYFQKSGCYFFGKSIKRLEGVKNPNLEQCLFGLPQLKTDNGNTVALVESEKTAIVMTGFTLLGKAPNLTWIATGGSNGIKWAESKNWLPLRGRKVMLYPDIGAFEQWKSKCYLIGTKVLISDYLERSATSEQSGLDVADFFISHYKKESLKEAQRI